MDLYNLLEDYLNNDLLSSDVSVDSFKSEGNTCFVNYHHKNRGGSEKLVHEVDLWQLMAFVYSSKND